MTAPLNASDAILARVREPARRDRPAILHSGGTMTCGELGDAVSRSANALAALGLARGERVCLLMNDSPRFCAAFLGAIKAGAAAVALNTRLPPTELAYIVGDCAARLVIADPEHLRGRARGVPGDRDTARSRARRRVARRRGGGGASAARDRSDSRRGSGVLAVFLRHDRSAESDHPQPGELYARRQAPARGRRRR